MGLRTKKKLEITNWHAVLIPLISKLKKKRAKSSKITENEFKRTFLTYSFQVKEKEPPNPR